jgi:hypothetical protein
LVDEQEPAMRQHRRSSDIHGNRDCIRQAIECNICIINLPCSAVIAPNQSAREPLDELQVGALPCPGRIRLRSGKMVPPANPSGARWDAWARRPSNLSRPEREIACLRPYRQIPRHDAIGAGTHRLCFSSG